MPKTRPEGEKVTKACEANYRQSYPVRQRRREEFMSDDFAATLSAARFERYLIWADGDRARALDLHALNTRVSEALYRPHQTLEVTLRNRMHAVLSAEVHDRWFDQDGFLKIKRQPR